MAVFVPYRNPDIGLAGEVKFRFSEMKYGDGYSLRRSDGINGLEEAYTLTWANVTPEQAATIEDFMKTQEGWQNFTYTLPFETEEKQWICRSMPRSYPHGPTRTVQVNIERVYILGTTPPDVPGGGGGEGGVVTSPLIDAGQGTVTVPAAELVPARAKRVKIIITHTGIGGDAFVGEAGVNENTGLPIPANAGYGPVYMETTAAIFAVKKAGMNDAVLAWMELYNP